MTCEKQKQGGFHLCQTRIWKQKNPIFSGLYLFTRFDVMSVTKHVYTYFASLTTKLMTGSRVFWNARCNTWRSLQIIHYIIPVTRQDHSLAMDYLTFKQNYLFRNCTEKYSKLHISEGNRKCDKNAVLPHYLCVIKYYVHEMHKIRQHTKR